MPKRDALSELIDGCGAVLVRHSKHPVYHLPNGGIFVIACTPSDARSRKNELLRLRRMLRSEFSGRTHDKH